MNKKITKQDGFIKEVILVLGILLAVKYFWHFDVVGYLEIKTQSLLNWISLRFK